MTSRFPASRLVWLGLILSAASAVAQAADPIGFNEQIRPILSDKCFHCHGPDDKHIKGDLQLHSFEFATKPFEDGRRAIVPGKPEESSLIERITSDDEDEIMPPKKSHKTLSDTEKKLLERWIAEGANYQPHWAFIVPQRAPDPQVTDAAWPRNSIDRFILARLEKEGLSPAPQADKATLLRRLSLDLTGLPPSLAELDAFLADASPDAYEKQVERLLASPRYGEHFARLWLDAARYGDTHGLHLDNYREIWPYRDWVVRAFNTDMPFDRFVVQQLAGDLLENADDETRLATGFGRCNVTTSEGGSINEECLVRYANDKVANLGSVFLGLTTGCAQCHTHKFDPISIQEYYQLSAFFRNLQEPPLDGNQKDPGAVLKVADSAQKEQLARLDAELKARRAELNAWDHEVKFREWLAAGASSLAPQPPADPYLHLDFEDAARTGLGAKGKAARQAELVSDTFTEGKVGRAFRSTPADFIAVDAADFERDQSFSYGAWIFPRKLAGAPLARMDNGTNFRGWDLYLDNDGHVFVHLIHSWSDNVLRVHSKTTISADKWSHVFVTYDGSSRAEGIRLYIDGISQETVTDNNSLSGSIRAEVPFKVGRRNTINIFDGDVDEVLIYDRQLSSEEVAACSGNAAVHAILAKPADKRSKEDHAQLVKLFASSQLEYHRLVEAEKQALSARNQFNDALPSSLILAERPGKRHAHVLDRGVYDQRREEVFPATPAFLPPLQARQDNPDRLDLARWLVRPEHPLTARVAVNRFWLAFFGTGLVKTAEDFGSQGELPSHPQLLDALAVDFRDSGWQVKRLLRSIVLSATYRQSSVLRPGLLDKDPANRLLARGPRFRLDAEQIRDSVLASSGLLNGAMFGPPVKPYQPEGIWEAVGYLTSNTRNYQRDQGDKLYRRSLYTFIKRTAINPVMKTFDAPDRESTCVRRERTNTPLQALAMMNEEGMLEASRHAAAQLLARPETDERRRLAAALRLVLCREARPAELDILVAGLARQRQLFAAAPHKAELLLKIGASAPPRSDPVETAAWTMLFSILFNSDEFLTKG